MTFYKFLLIICLSFISCTDQNRQEDNFSPEMIKAVDLSFLPEAQSENAIYNYNSQLCDPLKLLKTKGCNYVRIRLWHNPTNEHSSFDEVKSLCKRVREAKMGVWLTVHYSDTWADPGHQSTPSAWSGLSFQELKIQVTHYTTQIMRELRPDIIQIGNEINSGFLHPHGHLMQNEIQCIELLQTAIHVVNQERRATKVMIHYAGLNGSSWFFNKMQTLNYDFIGISYYPIWHGQSLDLLNETITNLGNTFQRPVIIAETSYPFTLGWNDWTNNVVGLPEHLIPGFPASPQGQKDYLLTIKNIVANNSHASGFAYWGAEWIAFRGPQATNGSSWENQTFWDFQGNALPILDIFQN